MLEACDNECREQRHTLTMTERYSTNLRSYGAHTLVLLLVTVLSALAGSLLAQKAEPARIEFEAGSMTTTVNGSLRNRQQMDYVVYGREKQELVLQLTTEHAGNLALKLYDPQGAEMTLEDTGPNQWRANLRQSGDYGIQVRRISRKQGVSIYDLGLTVHSASN
jgi:hypothetical protein